MVVEFSIELLEKLQLNPNEYFILILLKQKEFNLIINFLKANYTQEESIALYQKFLKMKYLTSTSVLSNYFDYTLCKLGNEAYSKLKTDDMFEEFLELYPKSVVRTDGMVDYLRTDQKHCKNMYTLFTKLSRARHEHIMKCLQFEIDKRNRDGSMKFMVRMSKWLSTETWKAYEDEINNTLSETKSYGTDIE